MGGDGTKKSYALLALSYRDVIGIVFFFLSMPDAGMTDEQAAVLGNGTEPRIRGEELLSKQKKVAFPELVSSGRAFVGRRVIFSILGFGFSFLASFC